MKTEFKRYAVILAAGNAKRMNDENLLLVKDENEINIKAFVKIAHMPLIFHILNAIIESNSFICVSIVINNLYTKKKIQEIEKFLEKINVNIKYEFIIQKNALGTGDAVLQFLEKSKFSFNENDCIAVFLGDHPLVRAKTIEKMCSKFDSSEIYGLISSFELEEENSYGRIELNESGFIKKIHEHKDYKNDDRVRKIHLCNGCIFFLKKQILKKSLSMISNQNAAGEFYLLDIIDTILEKNKFLPYIFEDSAEALGANTFKEIHLLEHYWQVFERQKFLQKKIHFANIESVYFAPFVEIADICEIGIGVVFKPFVKIGKKSKIENYCILGENLTLGETCIVKNHSILSDSNFGSQCEIGPFAYINSENQIGSKNIIGNFVEIKRSRIGACNKAKHFAYIADAEIGDENNFGAGGIFCNYDGKKKQKIKIGSRNFIGANVSLIAPLEIGNSNLLAAGSVISKDINSDCLSIERGEQKNLNRKKL